MTSLSKEEYLKRYLSPAEGGVKRKKKRKIRQDAGRGLKIVDDDVSWKSIAPKVEEEEILTDEDKPQIAVIDNRTEEEKKLDEYRKNDRWKTLGSEKSNGEKASKKRQFSKSDSDLEVKRNSRHDSDSDIEVKRKSRHDSDSDLEVKRKSRNESDSDLEVERNSKQNTDSDLDVKRKSKQDAESDLKVKRQSRHDSDSEVTRKVKRKNSSDLDITHNKKNKRPTHMSSGGRGGLTSRKKLKQELQIFKKNESALDNLANETKENATVLREKGGKKRDLVKEKALKDAKDEATKKRMDKYETWGRGIAQTDKQTEARSDLLHETTKPLARYADDEDLDRFQRSIVRDGDPMANYIKQKKEREEKIKFPKYVGPQPAPNRYHIAPGYRWDGVDRSNGFEKKYFESINTKSTVVEDAYKWSVEDM